MITIYTDGSSHPDGRGGAAAVLTYGRRRKVVFGSWSATTNQRMELQAAILGLQCLSRRDLPIRVVSDSEYVVKGMSDWVTSWEARYWKNSSGKPVANQDLWQKLIRAADGLNVEWVHVRGHTGEPGNEEVHRIAEEAMRAA